MTPHEIKSALQGLGGGANKRLGQHFLIDETALRVIVAAANIHPGDRVLEIGPGLGVLTRALLDHGADLMAIEQDRRFVEYLERALNYPLGSDPPLKVRGGGRVREAGGVTVVHGDAATIHWHALIGDRPWKLISNLPYSLTSLALRKALWSPRPPEVVVVLVQREVAERAVSIANKHTKGKTSLLSLMVALSCSSARVLRRVPRGAFFPPPKVESAILQLVPMSWDERRARWGIDPEKIMQVAKLGFAHPRKFLLSNLVGATSPLTITDPRSTFHTLGLSPKVRAENLTPANWAQLTIRLTSEASLDTHPQLH